MTNETALTISEQSQLSELEDIIDRGLQTFYEVGKALTIIRDEKLYRAGYATFEDYCEEKWQMSRAYAYRTIGAADVVKSLSPIGDIPLPRNEAQARPLTSLEPEQRQQAWTKAVEESGGQPTAKQVRRAADTVSGAVYESIYSLQSAVLAFHKRVCVSNKDMIASLEMLKNDHKSAGWGPLSLALSRDGKIFRVSDLRQAVNNALDSMRFTAGQTTISQPSEPAQETELPESLEQCLLGVLHRLAAPVVWDEWREKGITNEQLREMLSYGWGLGGGTSGPGTVSEYRKGGANPRFWYNAWGPNGDPTLQGAALVAKVREVLELPLPQTEKHWGLGNGMAFWKKVNDLGVTRSGILEFLQPGAKYLTDLNMTKEEAFARLAEAPRRVDAYDPAMHADGTPVLNGEQDAQMSQGQVFATLPDPPPSDMVMATNSLRVNIESIPVNVRQELAQEFRWWSDDDKKQLMRLTGIKRDVCSARSILLVTIANLLDVN